MLVAHASKVKGHGIRRSLDIVGPCAWDCQRLPGQGAGDARAHSFPHSEFLIRSNAGDPLDRCNYMLVLPAGDARVVEVCKRAKGCQDMYKCWRILSLRQGGAKDAFVAVLD